MSCLIHDRMAADSLCSVDNEVTILRVQKKRKKGLNILGKEETESNGHRSRVEPVTLIETMKSLKMELQSCRADNERIIKVQEELNHISTQLLQSLNQLQRRITSGSSSRHKEEGRPHARRENYKGSKHSRSASRTHRQHYSPTYLARKSSSSEELQSSSEESLVRHQRRNHELDSLQGELRKFKPPTFDGEHKNGEEVETWLLGIRKYFQLHNYSSNLEARIAIYHLQGKASLWWDHLKHTQHINEKKISWKQFKKYFQQHYLSENYYDKKMQEFFELKLGNMSVEEYENKFLELLRYVGFIKEEQVRIQRFLSGLPSFYRDEIQFNEPKTLEEAIRKAKYLYEQKKRRAVVLKSWRDEKNDNIDQRKKGFKPPSFKSSPIAYQQSQSAQSEPKMAESSGKKRPRSPIKCWGCKGEHMYRYCPHKGDKMRTMHDIQEATTVEDVGRVGRSIPMIYVALEDHDQSHMILQDARCGTGHVFPVYTWRR